MASDPATALTERQRELLALVVEEYVASGQPVGSRHLVERGGLRVSPSTVRNELAELESQGLLTHPHTSAGRIPTEQGIDELYLTPLPVSVQVVKDLLGYLRRVHYLLVECLPAQPRESQQVIDEITHTLCVVTHQTQVAY